MKPFLAVSCLLALASLAEAQEAAKEPAAPPFKASLLLIKNDWSKVPAAKEIETDLQLALKDVPVLKDWLDALPSSGPAILFAPELASIYSATQYGELLAWLKSKGLIEKTLPLENPQVYVNEGRGRPGQARVITRTFANYFQKPDFVALPPLPQTASQPFIEREVGFTWQISLEVPNDIIQIDRSLGVAEKRRGQTTFEPIETLDQEMFAVLKVVEGSVVLMHAFPGEPYLGFRRVMGEKGHNALLVIDRNPGKPAQEQPARLALPQEVQKISFGAGGPRLAWPGEPSPAPGPGRGGRGPLRNGTAPQSPANVVPSGAPIATQVTDREQINIYQLQHIRAEALLVMLQEQFGRTARLTADTERQRIISSTNTQAEADKITALIKKLDEPPPPGAAAAGGGEAAANQEFVVVPLKHVRSESLFQIIKQLLPLSARLIEDSDQQRLIVQGTPADLKTVTEAIARLDTPPQNAFPGKAATAQNANDPNAPDPTRTQRDPASFLQQLQQQYLYGHLTPQQGSPASGDPARQYQSAEQEAQALAQQWRTLTARPQGDVNTSADIAAAKSKLQAAVARAFEARQKQQQAELLEMQRRIYGLANTIEGREKVKDQIIDRRVQDLLNPALEWNPPAAANAPAAANPLNAPRGGILGQGARAKKARRVNGDIFQLQGDLVHIWFGSDDGLKFGQILHVYRGDEPIAELEVLTMQPDHCVARIKSKTGSLRLDDRVLTKVPAPPIADPNNPATGSQEQAGRPLSDAVREFNAKLAAEPRAKDLPPLTDDEVVAAVRWRALSRQGWRFTDAQWQALLAVAEMRIVPPSMILYWSEVPLAKQGPPFKYAIGIQFQSDPSRLRFQLREQFGTSIPDGIELDQISNTDTPLYHAINRFNQRYKDHPIGKNQPPLSNVEVRLALQSAVNDRNDPVTTAELRDLEKAFVTGVLPPDAEIEVLTSFQPNDEFLFDAWSVRLRMPRPMDGGSYAYTIRDRWLRVKKLKERDIAWGPVAPNGLQVGLWIDPASEVLTKGQQIVPHFYFRNASEKEQSLALPRIMTHSYYEAIEVTDDTGTKIQIDQDEGPGGPVGWTQLPFPPGTEHEVTGLRIAIGQVKRAPGVETVICAEPGQQCRLRFVVDNYLDPDKKEKLTTGEFRFALAKET